jgi:hypothetical protein
MLCFVHHEVTAPAMAGSLGPRQRVFYAEFDGKRDKRGDREDHGA